MRSVPPTITPCAFQGEPLISHHGIERVSEAGNASPLSISAVTGHPERRAQIPRPDREKHTASMMPAPISPSRGVTPELRPHSIVFSIGIPPPFVAGVQSRV